MISKEELVPWEEKLSANKTWVNLRTFFKDIWTATMRFQGDTTHKHGFKNDNNAEENRGDKTGRLANNLHKVAVAATSNKEHIQQMTTQNNDLLKVVRKQQAQIDKQKTHIDEMLKQKGHLIKKVGTNTNTGGATSAEVENIHFGRYHGNRNSNSNGNRNTIRNDTGSDDVADTNNRTNNCPK